MADPAAVPAAKPAAKPAASLKSDLIIKETNALAGKIEALDRDVKLLGGYVKNSNANIVAAVEAVHHRITAREHLKTPPEPAGIDAIIKKLDLINAKIDTTRNQVNVLTSRIDVMEQKLDQSAAKSASP